MVDRSIEPKVDAVAEAASGFKPILGRPPSVADRIAGPACAMLAFSLIGLCVVSSLMFDAMALRDAALADAASKRDKIAEMRLEYDRAVAVRLENVRLLAQSEQLWSKVGELQVMVTRLERALSDARPGLPPTQAHGLR